ncbi:MAG TPA: hypothetical protein VHX44_11285 [Planctomycetota bacterium]|nr:hypothetical protein [Planctomycetota bacterium]
MNALIDQWGARNVGIALMVVAALFLIAAGLIGWEAVQRGLGIVALGRAQAEALTDDRRGVIADGREAASWMPREPAAGLIAIDLSDPNAGAALETLELRVPLRQRQVVAAMRALHQLHHGGKPDRPLAAGDQAIVNHLMKLDGSSAPPPLTLPDADPPQAPLLAYAAQQRFRTAWASGDVAAIRMTAGELRLIMPRHPDVGGVVFALNALTPMVSDERLRSLASSLPKGPKRDLILLKLMTLAPTRTAVLTPLLPAATAATTGAGK